MLSSDKLDFLCDSIDSKFLHSSKNDCIFFKETGKEAKLKRINFVGFGTVVPINQDKFNLSPSKLLFKFTGYNKTCDGVFFFIIDNKPKILIFDVKSSRSNTGDHILKMKAGENFVNYVKSTSKIFSGIDFSEFECHFCVFYPEFNPKKITSLKTEISCDPNNPSYIAVENDESISARKILGLKIA